MAILDTEEKLKIVLDAIEDKKAEDVKVVDLTGLTLIADYFIICSGTSNTHIRSIVDGIIEKMKDQGVKDKRTEGYSQARWVLLDYGDIVIHVFAPEEREYYDIESLWKKTAERLETAEA
jgi:ribosome-associated protein